MLGEPASPRWAGLAQADYAQGRWTAFVQGRYIAPALFHAGKREGVDTNRNRTPATCTWTRRSPCVCGSGKRRRKCFLSVTNLLDRSPTVATRNPTTFSSPTSSVYDPTGRYVTLGTRSQL